MLGAGPAGLTAAYTLARRGRPAVVFEADGVVGGIAKTVEFQGYRFDLGGHRFFTKLQPIERLWEEMLGDELLTRPRLSRIYYQGKFFSYPLVAKDVLGRLCSDRVVGDHDASQRHSKSSDSAPSSSQSPSSSSSSSPDSGGTSWSGSPAASRSTWRTRPAPAPSTTT